MWERRLQWLNSCLQFIEDGEVEAESRGGGIKGEGTGTGTVDGKVNGKVKGGKKGAARLIDWLTQESRTGYPDVEAVVLDLLVVAERAWVRGVAGWILYGVLPNATLGRGEFFVQSSHDPLSHNKKDEGGNMGDWEDGETEYRITSELTPTFVTPSTAHSILFVGKSLAHIKSSGMRELELTGPQGGELMRENLKRLEGLQYPLSPTSFSAAITGIRAALAQNVLRKLLPVEKVVQVLDVLRQFFLLGRGEFAVALVGAADEALAGRHLKGATSKDLLRGAKDVNRLGGIMIKEGEVAGVLDKTWAALAALQSIEDEEVDEGLDMARDMVELTVKRGTTSRRGGAGSEEGSLREIGGFFEDSLLATPTVLTIHVASPLDLFLTARERDVYALINAYLLSVRRAHLHLSGLWRLSVLRRLHPSPRGFANSMGVPEARSTANRRNMKMRSHWAAISSATFFLAELGEYLQGEVIAGSWDTFRSWINPPATADSGYAEGKDPEILTSGHRIYLNALLHNLLLTDTSFASSLKNLLTRSDHLVALTTRLSTVQEALGADGHGLANNLTREESNVYEELEEISKSVQDTLKRLGQRLNEIDQERLGQGLADLKLDGDDGDLVDSELAFEPWRGGGVRNLLMRLDFRAALDD